MWPKLYLISVALLCAAAMSGIASADDTSPGTPSTVVASQGGATITLDDLDAFAQTIPVEKRAAFFDNPSRIENLITQLLLQRQLAEEARKNGLDTDAVVQKQVALAIDDALGKARMRQVRDDIKLPNFDQLAKEEFIANKEKYAVPSKINVKHVLLGSSSRSEAEAKALAETVEREARAHPDQFDALVEKYSDDPSKADNHGLMVDAGDAGRYLREFTEVAKQLQTPGEISPILKTEYGFHVLQLVSRTQAKAPDFAEAKAGIVAKLRSTYVDKQVATHADTLRNLPFEANPDLVAALRSRYGTVERAPAPPAASK